MDLKTIQQLNRNIGYITGVLQGMVLTSTHAPIAQDDIFIVLAEIEKILDKEFEEIIKMKFAPITSGFADCAVLTSHPPQYCSTPALMNTTERDR